jgi:hypothetical protein
LRKTTEGFTSIIEKSKKLIDMRFPLTPLPQPAVNPKSGQLPEMHGARFLAEVCWIATTQYAGTEQSPR